MDLFALFVVLHMFVLHMFVVHFVRCSLRELANRTGERFDEVENESGTGKLNFDSVESNGGTCELNFDCVESFPSLFGFATGSSFTDSPVWFVVHSVRSFRLCRMPAN